MEYARNSQTHYWTIGLTHHGQISARPVPALIMGGAGNNPGKNGGGSGPRVTTCLNCRKYKRGRVWGRGRGAHFKVLTQPAARRTTDSNQSGVPLSAGGHGCRDRQPKKRESRAARR